MNNLTFYISLSRPFKDIPLEIWGNYSHYIGWTGFTFNDGVWLGSQGSAYTKPNKFGLAIAYDMPTP